MEGDGEIKGDGNSYDFGARMYDPRIGRWLSLDPLAKKYPEMSPYAGIGNNPILMVDPDGNENIIYIYIGSNSGLSKQEVKLAIERANSLLQKTFNMPIEVIQLSSVPDPGDLDDSDTFLAVGEPEELASVFGQKYLSGLRYDNVGSGVKRKDPGQSDYSWKTAIEVAGNPTVNPGALSSKTKESCTHAAWLGCGSRGEKGNHANIRSWLIPQYAESFNTSKTELLAFLMIDVAGHNAGVWHDPGNSFMTDGNVIDQKMESFGLDFEAFLNANSDVIHLMLERKFTGTGPSDNLEKNKKRNEILRNGEDKSLEKNNSIELDNSLYKINNWKNGGG